MMTLFLVGLVPAPSHASPGDMTRVSVTSGGLEANGWSAGHPPAITPDARYIAFESGATNLDPSDTNGRGDIYVHDRTTGLTDRASVGTEGQESDGDSQAPSISADGRFVAFLTRGNGLDDTGWEFAIQKVFVRDRLLKTTIRASVTSTEERGGGDSYGPAISADGRFVAFASEAWNLDPHPEWTYQRGLHVYVRDIEAGLTERTSGDHAYTAGDVSISADGRFVAFSSDAPTHVPGDTNELSDIFVRDRIGDQTFRASVSSSEQQANGLSARPSISADGRFVTFDSLATNLVSRPVPGDFQVFVRDRVAGVTKLISASETGEPAWSRSIVSAISPDGRFVGFFSSAMNLVTRPAYFADYQAFVKDHVTGRVTFVCRPLTETTPDRSCQAPSVSSNARFIAIATGASNLIEGDHNDEKDVFLFERPTETRVTVSVGGFFQGRTVGESPCVAARKVNVKLSEPGTDRVVTTAKTDTDGVYKQMVRPIKRARYYSQVYSENRTTEAVTGSQAVVCLGAKSAVTTLPPR